MPHRTTTSKNISRLSLGLLACLCVSAARAEETAPPPPEKAPATTPPAAPVDTRGPLPGTGEIQLTGEIHAVDINTGTFTLIVSYFILPGGRGAYLKDITEKTVAVSAATRIRGKNDAAIPLADLPEGIEVSVTGPDTGTGSILAARYVSSTNMEPPIAPLTGNPPVPTASDEPSMTAIEVQELEPVPAPLRSIPPGFLQKGKLLITQGRISTFGGPADAGVSADEGLAIGGYLQAGSSYFLPFQPPGTTGLARRLNPNSHYIACRWDYNRTPRRYLASIYVTVTNVRTGRRFKAKPIDYGPHTRTGRVADLSPGLAASLGVATDAECRVEIPLP